MALLYLSGCVWLVVSCLHPFSYTTGRIPTLTGAEPNAISPLLGYKVLFMTTQLWPHKRCSINTITANIIMNELNSYMTLAQNSYVPIDMFFIVWY